MDRLFLRSLDCLGEELFLCLLRCADGELLLCSLRCAGGELFRSLRCANGVLRGFSFVCCGSFTRVISSVALCILRFSVFLLFTSRLSRFLRCCRFLRVVCVVSVGLRGWKGHVGWEHDVLGRSVGVCNKRTPGNSVMKMNGWIIKLGV